MKFELSPNEVAIVEYLKHKKFINEDRLVSAIGGAVTYHFLTTSIGDAVSISFNGLPKPLLHKILEKIFRIKIAPREYEIRPLR